METPPEHPLTEVRRTFAGAEVWGRVWTAGRPEAHLLAWPTTDAPFAEQWRAVSEAYESACAAHGLSRESETLVTVHLSDPANQRVPGAGRCLSVVGQPPAGLPARLALRATHLGGGIEKHAVPGGLRVTHGANTHTWLPDLAASGPEAVFERLRLLAPGLARQLVRTWIVVRDIDLRYGELLEARREAFREAGLGPLLPASTGIGGTPARAGACVNLTALLLDGLTPSRLTALAAPDHLPPAPSYGASFERGLAIAYADRRHLHLSGTASIGPDAEIRHEGDVAAQTRRTLENLTALLASAGASLADLAYLLVYLRDAADASTVRRVLADEGWGGLPHLVLHAPVCRPGWLVEIEGLAIQPFDDPRFPPF